jgi:hypothetical protein
VLESSPRVQGSSPKEELRQVGKRRRGAASGA